MKIICILGVLCINIIMFVYGNNSFIESFGDSRSEQECGNHCTPESPLCCLTHDCGCRERSLLNAHNCVQKCKVQACYNECKPDSPYCCQRNSVCGCEEIDLGAALTAVQGCKKSCSVSK